MAVGLAEHLLAERGVESWEVRSAGTSALEGSRATPLATQIMAERGIDISEHRAHQVREADLAEAHLVLTMTDAQRQVLISEFPAYRDKIHLLSQWAGQSGDIEDPIGSPAPEAYRHCADEIEALLRASLPRLLELAPKMGI